MDVPKPVKTNFMNVKNKKQKKIRAQVSVDVLYKISATHIPRVVQLLAIVLFEVLAFLSSASALYRNA